MDTIFMSSKNSKASNADRLLLNLTHKLNSKSSDTYVVLSNLSIYQTWKNINKSYKNSKSKISGPTWNVKFTLHVASYYVSDIWDYFE